MNPVDRSPASPAPRRVLSPATVLCLPAAMVLMVVIGCIGDKPANPAATQPATAIDLATTQPSYWLTQPAAAQVRASDFDTVWNTCKDVARDYLFELDRTDYRGGLISTKPLVSKQIFEPWRPDTGTLNGVLQNTVATIRRTMYFEIARNTEGSFTVTPKVLVEREAIIERRVTSAVQYRQAFSGPMSDVRYAVRAEGDPAELSTKYWYPVARDTKMEEGIARKLGKRLDRPAAAVAAAKTPDPVAPTALLPDGTIANVGASQTIYIALGAADKVVPGMTFEVYGSRASLPPLEEYTQQNRGSKGWIEVVKVANNSSTCKVLNQQGSAPMAAGDLLFNFVYDRKGANHFVLAGEFDSPDRETVSGLIWRWNGVVDEQVGPGATYLLIGREPRASAEKQAFDAAKARAQELKIPVITGEQFNRLIRHYDPTTR